MHRLIKSLTVTLNNRCYFNYLASLYLKTETILFMWTCVFPYLYRLTGKFKRTFLVPFFSLSSPFSFIGKWCVCCHLEPLFWTLWCWARPWALHGPRGGCALYVEGGCLICTLLGYRLSGGICIYLENFIYHLSLIRQYLFLLQLILPERPFIRQSPVHIWIASLFPSIFSNSFVSKEEYGLVIRYPFL